MCHVWFIITVNTCHDSLNYAGTMVYIYPWTFHNWMLLYDSPLVFSFHFHQSCPKTKQDIMRKLLWKYNCLHYDTVHSPSVYPHVSFSIACISSTKLVPLPNTGYMPYKTMYPKLVWQKNDGFVDSIRHLLFTDNFTKPYSHEHLLVHLLTTAL